MTGRNSRPRKGPSRRGQGGLAPGAAVVWSAIEALESRRLLSGTVLTISGAPTASEGQNYTLNLSASAGANLTSWTINWGDGTPSMPDLQTVPGSTSSVIHRYADSTTAYSITATGTDGTNTFAANTSPGGVNGTLDAGFRGGGKFIDGAAVPANAIAVQQDGKIVVAGTTSSGFISVTRYNADGTLDNSFGTAGTVTTRTLSVDIAHGVTIDYSGTAVTNPNYGKIIVVGSTATFGPSGLFNRVEVIRFNADGSLDTTFNGSGKFFTTNVSQTFLVNGGTLNSVLVDSAGRIVVGGVAGNATGSGVFNQVAVGRLMPDGTVDPTFGTFGNGFAVAERVAGVESDGANSIAIQADGKIVAAGQSNNRDAMVRFNGDGSLDTGFGASGWVYVANLGGTLSSVAIDASGNVVAAGTYNNQWAVMRVTSLGAADASFGNNGGGTGAVGIESSLSANTAASSLAIQSDGQIVASGSTDTNGVVSDFATIRYNPDGTQDGSFGSGGLVVTDFGSGGDFANTMALRPDGRIIVAGQTIVNDPILGTTAELAMEQFGIGVSATPVTVLVSDVAPQITLNNVPTSSAEGTTISASANVSDFDPSELTNTWVVTKNGSAYASGTGTAINFTPNDNGTYVLTFTSSDSGGAVGTASATDNVFNVAPTAAISGDTIGVRGQTRHISLSATDPSTVDTAAGFTYTINWGDGSANQAVLPGGPANPGHVYSTIGNFHVSVTATDKDGGVSAAVGQTIAITPIALEGTTLAVGGLTADDLIVLAQNSAGGSRNLYVSDDLLLLYKLKEALFTQVDVYQQDADGIIVAQNVTDAVYLVDANGNIIDTLHAAHP